MNILNIIIGVGALLLFINVAVIEMSQSFKEQDIHVEAFVRDRRILQLHVTILKMMESNYDLMISSVDEAKRAKHCNSMNHCVRHGIEKNQSSVTVPQHNLYIVESDPCFFQNDCTYNITAKALNGKMKLNTLYHIKECVNGQCLCRDAEKLPEPVIRLKSFNKKYLSFNWEVPSPENETVDASLRYVNIDIDDMGNCDAPWSHSKSIDRLHPNLDNFGVRVRKNDYTKELPDDLKAKCLRIRMSVVDAQNCQGPQVFLNVTMEIENANQDSVGGKISVELIVICLAGVMITLCAIILVVYGLLWQTRKKNIVNYWRGIYHNAQHGGVQMIPMRENILYFEKDSDNGDDWFEIPPSAIREIGREIGKGAFGRVFIARISEIPKLKLSSQIVAIKKLKKSPTTDQLEEFLGEISTMKKVGNHPNVVRLLGFCTLQQPLMMIMEFVPCGDLLKYLRTVRSKHETMFPKISSNPAGVNNNSMKNSTSNHSQILGPLVKYLDVLHSHSTSSASETSSYITQPDSLPSTLQINGGACTSRPSFAETMYTNLTVPSNCELTSMLNTNLEHVVDHKELHNFAIQIARGMKHLQDLQITHRDLAARNILIDENKTLKISDFGLSRIGIYVTTRNKKVPLRWLSIEAMKDNLYSSKSDVWAFAIVLWEIGTLGGFPYPTVSNHELLNYLKMGQRLERPENCSTTLYELMLKCWAADSDDRPDFGDICRTLDPNKNKIYIDFSELSPSYVFPPTCEDVSVKKITENPSKA